MFEASCACCSGPEHGHWPERRKLHQSQGDLPAALQSSSPHPLPQGRIASADYLLASMPHSRNASLLPGLPSSLPCYFLEAEAAPDAAFRLH